MTPPPKKKHPRSPSPRGTGRPGGPQCCIMPHTSPRWRGLHQNTSAQNHFTSRAQGTMPLEVLRLAAPSRHPGWRQAPPRHLGHRAGMWLTYSPPKPGWPWGRPAPCSNPSCATRKSTNNLRIFQLVIIAALGALSPARPFYRLAVRCGARFGVRIVLGLVLSCLCTHVAALGAPDPPIFVICL